jgi:protein-L-isoaspartate(D-aspartate) O-methyltransferase
MNFAAARFNMVECQIRTNRVSDPRVLAALKDVPREVFVSKPMRSFAYVDEDLDVGGGRFVIEPLVLARLLEAAEIKPSDVVLNIGDATGYSTAVLSRLAQTVVALESDPDWVVRSSQSLTALNIDNAAVVGGALLAGCPAQAPFNVIVLSGAVDSIPQDLRRQLADGGRLVGVVGSGTCLGKAVLVVRVGDTWGQRNLFDASTAALPVPKGKPTFVF